MNRFPRTTRLFLFATLLAASAHGADPINWHGTDVNGASLAIPAADRATLVVLVRPGQAQSQKTLDDVKGALKTVSPQVILVVSGDKAVEQAKALAATEGVPGPVVADPEFSFSGDLGVHVWPEAIVVDAKGNCVGRLPGARQAGATELIGYLDVAAGTITQADLDKRLATQPVVVEPSATAQHLQVAKQMLANARLDHAASELAEAMKQPPTTAADQLLAARIMLGLGQIDDALAMLDKIPADAIPAPQRNVVRARALILSGKWADAIPLLEETTKLNPDPAEAYYLLGVALEHEGKSESAAVAFRYSAEAMISPEQKLPTPK